MWSSSDTMYCQNWRPLKNKKDLNADTIIIQQQHIRALNTEQPPIKNSRRKRLSCSTTHWSKFECYNEYQCIFQFLHCLANTFRQNGLLNIIFWRAKWKMPKFFNCFQGVAKMCSAIKCKFIKKSLDAKLLRS